MKRSLTTGVFLDNLKKTRVKPMPKEGDKYNLSNYIDQSQSHQLSAKFSKKQRINSLPHDYTSKIRRSYIKINMDFALRNLLLKQFYISKLQYTYIVVFSLSLDFRKHLIVLSMRFCYLVKYLLHTRSSFRLVSLPFSKQGTICAYKIM